MSAARTVLAPFVPDRDQGGLGAVLHAELGQHRTHVRLHRLLRDGQRPGDLPVGPALGDLGEHLALPAGERVQAGHRVPAAAVADQRAGRLQREQQVPVVHRADRPDQRVRVHVLVHHPGRARAQRQAGRGGFGRAGEHQYPGLAAVGLELGQHGDAVHAGQLEVEEDDVRGEFGGQGERGGAVAGLAGHLDPVLHLEQHPQAAPDHRVVVHDQHLYQLAHRAAFRGTVIRTVVPFGPDLMASRPPAAAARSRIDSNPRPGPPDGASGANPWPSSDTSSTTRRGVVDRATVTQDAPAWRSALCRASCATRYSAASAFWRSGGRQAAVNVTGTPCARPASTAYRRSDSASPAASRSGGLRPSMTARSSAWASAPSSPTTSISALIRLASGGSRAASTAAARACARMLNSFCVTASCRSRASRDRSCTTDSSRLRSYSRALVSAIAACAANSERISSSRSVNPCFSAAAETLLAAKMMPRTWSPSRTGTPRKCDILG